MSETFDRRDALSAVLFKLVLEDAIRKYDIQGSVNVRSVQTCSYADDALIANNRPQHNLVEELKTVTERKH